MKKRFFSYFFRLNGFKCDVNMMNKSMEQIEINEYTYLVCMQFQFRFFFFSLYFIIFKVFLVYALSISIDDRDTSNIAQ